jgi:hypothetical protein
MDLYSREGRKICKKPSFEKQHENESAFFVGVDNDLDFLKKKSAFDKF